MPEASKLRSSFKVTDVHATFVPGVVSALRLIHPGSAVHVQAAPVRSYGAASGFRIIFGLKDRTSGKSWNGSVVDRNVTPEPIALSTIPTRSYRQTAGDFADTSMFPTSEITSWSHPETAIRGRPAGTSRYYHVRVIQSYSTASPDLEGEIACSSPIFVRQK